MNKHRIHLFVLFSIIAYCNNVNAHIIDTLSYSVNELKIKANGNYTVFSMPFFQTTQEIGNPELPSATLYYIIPCDKRVVSITVLDSTMATIPGTYLVFPKQPETPIGNYRAYDFVNPNTSVYGSNNPYPEQPLSILDHCAIDGYQLVGISVCPLRYFSKSMAEVLRESVTGEPRTEEFACPDLPVTRGARGNTGVDESGNGGFSVSLTPNPAKSLVYVNYILPEGMPEAVLEITSVLGVKVFAVTLEGQRGSKEVDLSRLPPGVYNYTVHCGNNVLSGKLMITH